MGKSLLPFQFLLAVMNTGVHRVCRLQTLHQQTPHLVLRHNESAINITKLFKFYRQKYQKNKCIQVSVLLLQSDKYQIRNLESLLYDVCMLYSNDNTDRTLPCDTSIYKMYVFKFYKVQLFTKSYKKKKLRVIGHQNYNLPCLCPLKSHFQDLPPTHGVYFLLPESGLNLAKEMQSR